MMYYLGRVTVLLALGSFALAGCGLKKEDLNYNFTENGCSTGDQSFSSKEEYCGGLKNQTLNKGCSVKSRREAFERECAGQAWALTNFGPIDCHGETCDGNSQYCLSSFVGALKDSAVHSCRALPAGFNFEDGCESLHTDAPKAFPTSNNCGGHGTGGNAVSTVCSKNGTGSFEFSCYTTI